MQSQAPSEQYMWCGPEAASTSVPVMNGVEVVEQYANESMSFTSTGPNDLTSASAIIKVILIDNACDQ